MHMILPFYVRVKLLISIKTICECSPFAALVSLSLGLEDHKVSKLVWFHNLGIDGSNRVQHSWNMKTLETIMRDLHHRDVSIFRMKR